MWQIFPKPRDNFGSLVANFRIVKLLKLRELFLVRVFLEGYLRVIGRQMVSHGSKWYQYCHGYGQCFATGPLLARGIQGVVKHGRWNGYGAPDLCVMQVPPAHFHFYSMPGSIRHVCFDFFLKLLRKKAQFELNSQWIWDLCYYYRQKFFRILNHGWSYRECCSVDISLGSHSRGSIVFAKQLRSCVCL
jgi:hypothetical protein